MTQEDLLSWQETMQALQISSPTLYAIVGRQELMPSVVKQMGQQQRKFFRRDEVERLRRIRTGQQVEM